MTLQERNFPSPPLENIIKSFPKPVEVEEKTQPWKVDQIMITFLMQLKELDSQIRYPRLTMNKKTISFVKHDDVQAKTDEGKGSLINTYGHYMINNVAGDHRISSNSMHIIRIGYSDQEDIESKDQVLNVMSHEFGHTVRQRLKDPILEELKAYAFASLFMKRMPTVELSNNYLDPYLFAKAPDIHAVAKVWLSYLLENGFNEEDVLAHLTGRKFGNSYPKNYMKFLSIISSNISTELRLKDAFSF